MEELNKVNILLENLNLKITNFRFFANFNEKSL